MTMLYLVKRRSTRSPVWVAAGLGLVGLACISFPLAVRAPAGERPAPVASAVPKGEVEGLPVYRLPPLTVLGTRNAGVVEARASKRDVHESPARPRSAS